MKCDVRKCDIDDYNCLSQDKLSFGPLGPWPGALLGSQGPFKEIGPHSTAFAALKRAHGALQL